MLKILRNKKTAKKIWITLAIIIVPAFMLWGSGSLMRNRQEPAYAGKIFGRNIPLLEFKDALEAEKNEAIIQFGENFSEIKNSINFEFQAWKRLLLLYEAKKRKINASDEEVRDLIASLPFFQRNGKFNEKIYNETLQYVFRTQARIFEEQTRQNIIMSKLYKQITGNVKINDEEIKEEYRKLNEELSVYYIAALPSDYEKGINPSEKEIKDYFDKNPLQFKQPLSFNMEYVVSDSETIINDVVMRLNKKANFAKIAEKAGLTVKETGFFAQTDPIPGIGWSAEMLNLISKLKIGQYTPAIRSDKNYYILRLKEIKEPYVPDFEKTRVAAKKAFIKYETAKTAKTKINDCLEKLKQLYRQDKKSADFSKVSADYGLKFGSSPRFKYGSYIENIGSSDILWTAAEELAEDNFSGIISMPSGFYIIKLKERVPVEQDKFEKEKEDFKITLLAQKKQEAFIKFIEELKRKSQ